MKHFFKYMNTHFNDVCLRKQIPKQVRNDPRDLTDNKILLFLDYDGTLTPIADKLENAVIPLETKYILKKISKHNNIKLAIISGRSLEEVKSLVGIKNCIYAGNHGLEIKGPSINYKNLVSVNFRPLLFEIKKELEERLSYIKGILIEDKILTLSVHFRLVKIKESQIIKNTVIEVINFLNIKEKIELVFGKKVIDIRPFINWNKGEAVKLILEEQSIKTNNIFPIYIGDDTTDEDAFKVLKDNGLTIFVGKPRKSDAKFYLNNSLEVLEFLKNVLII